MTSWSWNDVIWGDQQPVPRPPHAGESDKYVKGKYVKAKDKKAGEEEK